jgi:O-antigen ligase
MLYAALVAWLVWADRTQHGRAPLVLWIPLAWVLLAQSRFPSQWLSLGQPVPVDTLEGSPLDSAVFALLIAAGCIVLLRRSATVAALLQRNPWIWLYFALGAVSVLWSDYAGIAAKRLVKASGNAVMVAVILTDPRPYVALGWVLRRCAYILIPLSIVFLKYFPELGRAYHMGTPMFTGVTTHKNSLGQLCLITLVYFCWALAFRGAGHGRRMPNQLATFAIVAMTLWLLYRADSATSTACAALGVGVCALARNHAVARGRTSILWLLLGSAALLLVLEQTLGLKDSLITLLGRRPDLTTRVPMWEDLLRLAGDPLLGYGYESFWLGPRQEWMGAHWGITSQAHNGYLEMYLNLGLVGLAFLLTWIASGVRNVAQCLTIDYPIGVLRFAFLAVVVLYNWTEATFYGVSVMWMVFLLGVMEVRRARQVRTSPPLRRSGTSGDARPAN